MSDLLLHGARLDAQRLRSTLDTVFQNNLKLQEEERDAYPVCIWGTHGIGKTQLVKDLASEQGWGFAYCAPAQFEEMGDLHGLPQIDDGEAADAVTRFAPPAWVPTDDGPGVLLLDDINRADDRILRGLMQLLQNFRMFSWKLPPRWQIVCTANPEGGDYSVTPMDDAMLTRMLHVTMVFDVKAWARWATRSGIDPRGVSFVLTYPEVVSGRRTTPRSLTQFFEQIRDVEDLKAERELVHALAMSSLEEATVAAFLGFVDDNLEQLLDPEDVLDAEDWKPVAKRLDELAGSDGAKRVDRLATVCTRIYLALVQDGYAPGERHQENLVRFLLHDALPNDLRHVFHKDLVSEGSAEVVAMMRDKRLADLLLAGL